MMQFFSHGSRKWLLTAFAVMLTCFGVVGQTFAQTRIVVLPGYVEDGADIKDRSYAMKHYRRIARFMNNQLVRHGFEVINPVAKDAGVKEYNRTMERAREDSSLAVLEMTRKYEADVAYVVWLTVKKRITSDGFCKVTATIEGEGYDSGARDLGVGVEKTMKYTKRECDEAIRKAEKEVGDLVGRKLTAWGGAAGSRASAPVVSDRGSARSSGGALQRNATAMSKLINLKLMEVTEPAIASVFGKVLNTTRGVVEAKRYRSKIMPENPQASYVSWRITIDGTDPFRVQENVMKAINDISDAGGNITHKGITYRYSAGEIDMLKGVRQLDATSAEVIFIVDRERARDMEMSGRHDPYKAKRSQPGFE